jgi:hypothetical protein
LPSVGSLGVWGRAVDWPTKMGWGRRVRCGPCPRCSPRLDFPRRRWKSPSWGLLPQNAWQSEGRGLGHSVRPPTTPHERGAKGELGPPTDPLPQCNRRGGRRTGPKPDGPRISAKAETLSDRLLPTSGALSHRASTVRLRQWLTDCPRRRFRRGLGAMFRHALRTRGLRKGSGTVAHPIEWRIAQPRERTKWKMECMTRNSGMPLGD